MGCAPLILGAPPDGVRAINAPEAMKIVIMGLMLPKKDTL